MSKKFKFKDESIGVVSDAVAEILKKKGYGEIVGEAKVERTIVPPTDEKAKK